MAAAERRAQAGQDRDHLDLPAPDQADEVKRVVKLGATRVDVGQTGEESFVVLAESGRQRVLRPALSEHGGVDRGRRLRVGGMDFLLVHGSTQTPGGYDRLAAALQGRRHRTVAADLPVDRPEWTAGQYADVARGQAGELIEPVLVVHSAAGVVAPAIAAAVGARHVAWLGAVVPDPGRSVLDELAADAGMFGAEWHDWTGDLAGAPAETAYFLFHDCDLATLRWALSTTRLWPVRSLFEAPGASLADLPPSTVIVPIEDRTLTPDWMRRVARDRLKTEPVDVPGGHCPHVSRPEQVAALLDR